MNSCPDGFVCINNFHMIYLSFISLLVLYLVINQYYKDIHEKISVLNQEIKDKKKEFRMSKGDQLRDYLNSLDLSS